MTDQIKYYFEKYFTPLLNKIKAVWGKTRNKHIKKQSKLNKDIVLGLLQLVKADHLVIGVKVLGPRGVGFIKEIDSNNYPYIRISYPGEDRVSDHKHEKLFQYKFSVHNKWKAHALKVYSLSYADYEYIAPDEVNTENGAYIEGTITNKGYFKITDEEKADRKVLTVYNETGHNQNVYRKLRDQNLLTKTK